MKLLIVNPFPPNKNPNPHIIDYVSSAASRVFGSTNVSTTRFSDVTSHLPRSDVILIFGALAYAIRETRSLSKICKKMNLPLCYWSTDDPYEIDTNLENSDCFDWIWTNDKASLQFYDREQVEHLPLAADSNIHNFTSAQESSYMYDVSFVGCEFPNRRRLLKKLQPFLEALDTAVIGPNWTVKAKFIKKARISNKDAAKVSNQSRVVLNMSRSYDLVNTRRITPSTPGPRTFEVGGCFTVQLMAWDQPEVEEYYKPGKEIILCDGLDAIEKEIEEIINDRQRRMAIAAASLERTKSSHLYGHRVQKIFVRIQSLLS